MLEIHCNTCSVSDYLKDNEKTITKCCNYCGSTDISYQSVKARTVLEQAVNEKVFPLFINNAHKIWESFGTEFSDYDKFYIITEALKEEFHM